MTECNDGGGAGSARRTSTARQVAGDGAEDRALAYLQQQGLRLCTRNFRCKAGEIDLIMNERVNAHDTLVFIEVRKRSSMRYGGAAGSVTPAKQARLIRAAHWYLARYRTMPPCRFDVIAFEREEMSWLKNAFAAA
ncbi:YraN family protein [Oxalobacteraceae bacterium CAVE-383]|nr:YraN family protein [Oxalobacteraceae bacterium CAVE-383]